MKSTKFIIAISAIVIFSCTGQTPNRSEDQTAFNSKTDLLLVQYDCKTDVDDLHSIAAFATLLSNPNFSGINYHAIAGTYGTQDGLYVPPDELLELAFGTNWTNAHNNLEPAIKKVLAITRSVLDKKGDVWIAEAGQSDFSAALVKAIQADMPQLNTTNRIHIVQHSDWNEEVTSAENLDFVKKNTDYQKIPDGNATNNGTPGFRSAKVITMEEITDNMETSSIWKLAINIANEYNGKDGRYLNEAIMAGGLDFSDFSEVCWILNLEGIRDSEHFFELNSKRKLINQ